LSEIETLFFELLFGSGGWFGLILLVAVALIVGVVVKYSSIIFMVIFMFLAWEYFDHITNSSMNAWFCIIALVVILFLGVIFYEDVTH
jgi:hypothetical protein